MRKQKPSAVLQGELNRRQSHNPKYSLRAFAKHLEISPSTLSKYISGKRKMSIMTIQHIAKTLNIDFGSAELATPDNAERIRSETPY